MPLSPIPPWVLSDAKVDLICNKKEHKLRNYRRNIQFHLKILNIMPMLVLTSYLYVLQIPFKLISR